MSNFRLNLPTDIPWERICVTEDMIDAVVCDDRLPAKWQSSLAVFKFRPDDEYQLFPKYNITYLKVTATITGYQPLDKEIQGNIDWNGLDVTTINSLNDLLNSYNPCHGAMLQVVVGPKDNSAAVPLNDFPFFMDFEPKKRELYEMASDTSEKQSRSLETLNITKSASNTQSTEILDIDMGGSSSFGAQGGAEGVGAGFSSSSSTQEKRETFSHSTQISQMYHLLDSYHAGTNRVVFFIQPRPHVLEAPSGFVRGPRPVDGIQEFFLVVAQLKEQKDFCVSVRLDTSHLTTAPIMDYERKSEITDVVSCTAPLPDEKATPAEYKVGGQACFLGECWDVHYQCYINDAFKDYGYTAPSGFRIEGYDDLINDHPHGSSTVTITPNGSALNIHVEARGHKCYIGNDLCLNCPETIEAYAGESRRQVQVNLISTIPTIQTGEEQYLMITTRALCCCAEERTKRRAEELVVSVKSIPSEFSMTKKIPNLPGYKKRLFRNPSHRLPHQQTEKEECDCKHEDSGGMDYQENDNGHIIRKANALSNYIKTETIRSLNDPTIKPQKFMETEFFTKQLHARLAQYKKGRETIFEPVTSDLPKEAIGKMEKYFKRAGKDISRYDLVSVRKDELVKITGLKPEEIQKLKLKALGLKFTAPARSKE
jgi:hypothetical protein